MYRETVPLSPTPPFSFAQTLNFVRAFYWRDYERVPAQEQIVGDALERVVSVAGTPMLFRVRETGTVEAPGLELTLHAAAPLTPELVEAAVHRVRFFLSLDDDLTPFYEVGGRDPVFSEVVDKLYGYHPLKVLTPFEAACWALIQQRTPNSFAHKTMARLAERFGGRLERDGRVHHAFPEATQMLDDPQNRVLEATNNTRKTERMLGLIRAFAVADETFLRAAPYEEVARWLGSIKGLGAWSVEFITLRGLGRYERTPWTDTGMVEAISGAYTRGLSISRGSARELAERYGWYQGLWAHYLKVYRWGNR